MTNIPVTFQRIVTAGAKNFVRSGAVSFATVLIMTVTLSIIGFLFLLSAVLSFVLTSIQDKVDINVYFVTTAQEDQIHTLEDKLEQLPETSVVTYTSREEALAQFKERHQSDQLTLQALQELGDNPLGASLAIKAKDPSQYGSIVAFLDDAGALSSGGTSIIDHVNYYQNKTVIDRLTVAINATQKVGMVIVALFSFASIVIVFASMRLAIYTARDEIAVMRLVGASNAYIRGPFLVVGILAGILAAIISLALFYPVLWYAGGVTQSWLGGFNLFTYYLSHFPLLFLLLVGSGILLGGISSAIAVRRYLKV